MSSIVVRTHTEFEHLPPLSFLHHQLILCITLSIILFSIFFNHQLSFTCLRNPFVSTPSSLHLERLLGYHLTQLSLLLVSISMLGLVVLSIFLPFEKSPFHHHLSSVLFPAHKTHYTKFAHFVFIFLVYKNLFHPTLS